MGAATGKVKSAAAARGTIAKYPISAGEGNGTRPRTDSYHVQTVWPTPQLRAALPSNRQNLQTDGWQRRARTKAPSPAASEDTTNPAFETTLVRTGSWAMTIIVTAQATVIVTMVMVAMMASSQSAHRTSVPPWKPRRHKPAVFGLTAHVVTCPLYLGSHRTDRTRAVLP